MKEKNRDQLKAAIDQLPTYKAETHIWDRLETDLEAEGLSESYAETGEAVLKEAVERLPAYPAPRQVWRKIERNLFPSASPQPWIARLAASFLVLILVGGVSWWALQPQVIDPPAKISETVNPNPQIELIQAQDLRQQLLQTYSPSLLNCLDAASLMATPEWEALHPILLRMDSLQQQGETVPAALNADFQATLATLEQQYCQVQP